MHRTLAASLVAASLATSCYADCWVDLPPAFAIQVGGHSSYQDEILVAMWKIDAATCKENGLPLTKINSTFQASISNQNPHYKTIMNQLYFAKANGFSLSLQVGSTMDPNFGYPINLVLVR